MGEYQNVKVSVEERIAILTIDHPPANAFDTRTVMDLNAAFDEVLANPEVKAIIITGAGQFAFVAGADINEINALKGHDDAKEVVVKGQQLFSKIEASPKPVIAAINAVCLGGGNELAMSCHIRIASDRARFGQPEINLGIIPGWGGTQRLPRYVGKGKAFELLFTGDMITAQEAFRIGLVNKVVPAGDVIKEAKGLAKKIVSKSALSLAAIIDAVNKGLEMDLQDALLYEAEHFAKLCETYDMREGVAAFLQKRQAKFEDR
ncbi:MAG: enoyl-CoA hydratase/isomerase family protein [Chloroflexi bacterium]|nr:enoyl-CoA hydratase/isomerase family protein [Chloroflexota bacterium]